jgi:hypothetical protein
MWKSAEVFEDIQNNSVCVLLEKRYIRKMKYDDDIENELVFVSNVPRILEKDNFIIKEHEMCRYKEIIILDKSEMSIKSC